MLFQSFKTLIRAVEMRTGETVHQTLLLLGNLRCFHARDCTVNVSRAGHQAIFITVRLICTRHCLLFSARNFYQPFRLSLKISEMKIQLKARVLIAADDENCESSKQRSSLLQAINLRFALADSSMAKRRAVYRGVLSSIPSVVECIK